MKLLQRLVVIRTTLDGCSIYWTRANDMDEDNVYTWVRNGTVLPSEPGGLQHNSMNGKQTEHYDCVGTDGYRLVAAH